MMNEEFMDEFEAKAKDVTAVKYHSDNGDPWLTFVKTADLHHAAQEWSTYLVTDDPIVVPAEKKGYEPDGFDREAFDDFMRNL